MSQPEIWVETGGVRHRLVITIGAKEEIAKVNDQFQELRDGFLTGRQRDGEVKAILDAAFRAAGSDMDYDRYCMAEGWSECVDLAYRCLELFFYRHDPGKNALGPVAQALAKMMQGNASVSTDT